VTESALTPLGCIKSIDRFPFEDLDARDDQLGDPIAPADGEGLRTEIEQDDVDFAAIVAVDGPWGIEQPESVAGGEAAPGAHLGFETLRESNPKACRYDGETARGKYKGGLHGRQKVVPSR